jgi:hypothetical protein
MLRLIHISLSTSYDLLLRSLTMWRKRSFYENTSSLFLGWPDYDHAFTTVKWLTNPVCWLIDNLSTGCDCSVNWINLFVLHHLPSSLVSTYYFRISSLPSGASFTRAAGSYTIIEVNAVPFRIRLLGYITYSRSVILILMINFSLRIVCDGLLLLLTVNYTYLRRNGWQRPPYSRLANWYTVIPRFAVDSALRCLPLMNFFPSIITTTCCLIIQQHLIAHVPLSLMGSSHARCTAGSNDPLVYSNGFLLGRFHLFHMIFSALSDHLALINKRDGILASVV